MLINNAAIQNTPSFIDDDFNVASIARSEINLNFTSICSLTALLLPLMRNHGDDAVIANINSGLALAPEQVLLFIAQQKQRWTHSLAALAINLKILILTSFKRYCPS